MAKGRKKKKQSAQIDPLRPTPEREARNPLISAGMAKRFVPAIDTLHERGFITRQEWEALAYYRDQAGLADRSPVKSCCDPSIGGGGGGPGVAILSAAMETGRIERALGPLRGIARAVAVDDKSLTQWCVEQYGGRERYDAKGRFVAVVPVRERKVIPMARMELRMAARRISK